jgi:hypothetical protein
MQSESEWRWFGASVRDSLIRPRQFAHALAREHFGLAGVLVVIGAGIALSLTIDAVVILSKGGDPMAALTRLIVDAFFLGLRVAIVVALVSLVVVGAARLTRRAIDMDRAFTALSFAMSPLLLAPAIILPIAVAASAPQQWRGIALAIASVLATLIVARFVVGVGLNLAGVIGRAAIVVAIVALVAMGVVLQDQVGRTFFTTLTFAPQLLPPPAPVAADGRDVSVEGTTFRVPAQWKNAERGVPGVVADYELPDARLVVKITEVGTLTTADSFASSQVQFNLRDFTNVERTERSVVRIDRAAALDDRWYGDIKGTRLVERQYAFVVGLRGYIFEFTFYTPSDERAALDQAAAIAASIRLAR